MAEEKITSFTAEEARELRGGRDLPNYLVQSYNAGNSGGNTPSASSAKTSTSSKNKNYLADSGKKLSEDKEHKQTFVEKAKSALSNAVDAVTGGNRSQKRLEKLQEKYGNATYDDDFWGQTKANFGAGRISEAEAQAWSDYMDDPTEENRQRAVSYSQLNQDFRTRNAEALDDENVQAGWLSKNIAGYLPQMGNQIKASLTPTVALTAGGALLGEATTPIPIADAAAGAALGYKAGRTVGTGFYSYQNMRGYAFKNLIEAGASESAAKDAAEDEAIVSSVIEMGDEAIEQFAKIPGISKAFKKVGGDAVSAIAGSGLKKAAKEYLKNIGQEYSEEFIQEVISIANERRVENGTTGSGIKGLINESINVIKDMASGAASGQVTDDLAQAHEAGVGGGIIGAVMFPANAAVGGVINTAQRNISQGIENRLDPTGASTRTALRNEINAISKMSQTAQEQAVTAWNSHRDQLGYAKTGDVLVGMMTRPDGSVEVNHVYGRVTGHVRDGFIMTLSDENNRPVVVPDGFLTNQTVISVLNNNGEFISQSELNERSDVSDITPEDAENVPFYNGNGQQQNTPEPQVPYQPKGQSFPEIPSVKQASDEFNQWFSQQQNTEAANGYKFTVDGVEYEVREVSRTNDGKPIYAVFHGSQKVSPHFQTPGDAIRTMSPLPAERAAEINTTDTANQNPTGTNSTPTSNENTTSNTSTTSVDTSNNTGNTNTSDNTDTEGNSTVSTDRNFTDEKSLKSFVKQEFPKMPKDSSAVPATKEITIAYKGQPITIKWDADTLRYEVTDPLGIIHTGKSAIISLNNIVDVIDSSSGQQPIISGYKSNTSVQEDIDSIPNKSNNELHETISRIKSALITGKHYGNMSTNQMKRMRDAIVNELIKRNVPPEMEQSDFEDLRNNKKYNTREDAIDAITRHGVKLLDGQYLYDSGVFGWVVTSGGFVFDGDEVHLIWSPVDDYIVDSLLRDDIITDIEADEIYEKGLDYWDAKRPGTDFEPEIGDSQDNTDKGWVPSNDDSSSNETPGTPEAGSSQNSGRNREVREGQSSGINIVSYENESGETFTELNIGFRNGGDITVTVKGRNNIIPTKNFSESQKNILDMFKRFRMKAVHFINGDFSTDGKNFSVGGLSASNMIGATLCFNTQFKETEKSVLYKHEFAHAIDAASFFSQRYKTNQLDQKYSFTEYHKKHLDAFKKILGPQKYRAAVSEIWKHYYSDVIPYPEKATTKYFTEFFENILTDEQRNLIIETTGSELFAQIASGDNCYGALDRSYAEDFFKNEHFADVMMAGTASLASGKSSIISEMYDFMHYGIDDKTGLIAKPKAQIASQEETGQAETSADVVPPESESTQTEAAENEETPTETAPESPQTTPAEEGKTAPPQQPETSTHQSDELNQPSTPTESNETVQEEQVDPKKLAKQEFREHYDDAVEKTNRLGRLRTIAERSAPKDAPKHEQRRAENFKKGMTTLKDNLRKLTSGEMKGDDFAQYYLGLNRSSDGMAAYYDAKTAARWQSVRDAWAEVKQSADPDNATRYSGELSRAVDQMVRSIERIDRAQRTLESMSETASKNGFDTKSKNIFKKIARTYLRWQINPTNVFRAIDGFDRNARGDGYRFQQRIDDSVADYQRLNVESQAALSKVKQMKNFQKFAAGQSMTNVHIGNTQLNTLQALGFIKTVDTLRATSPEKPFTISGFALDLGNGEYEFVEARDININKVYKQCTAAVDDVARAYKLAADEVFDLLGKRVMSTAEAINGYSPYAFEKGKYYPLWYKTNSTDGHNWSITHSIDGNLQEKRFTHERSEDNPGYLVVAPITKVVDDYITQATNYSAFGELGSDLELMNREENINGSISQMMAKNFGTEMAGWMKNYIDDVNEVIETDTEGINELFRAGRNMLAQGALLFSPSVQMKQVASYWNAAGVIRMDALTAAYRFKELRAKGGANGNALYDYRKLGNIDPTISDALKSGWVEKLSSKSKLFNNIANMTNIKDLRTVDNVYTACVLDTAMSYPSMDKNSATFQNLVEQKFQEAVLNTQPIFTKQARAEYARTDNEIVRMLAMFRTQQTQNFNRLITTLGEYNADRRNKVATSESAEALTQTIKGQIGSAFSFAALSVAADLLLHRTKKYRDDDGGLDIGAFLERLGLNAVEAGAATFWQVDNLAKWAIDKISGGETNEFYGISMGPVSTIADVVESVEYLLQTPSLSNLRYTAGYIGTLTGMPINNVYAMINSVAMYAKDLSGENKEHFDDLLKWTENENRPENQLIKSFTSGDTDRANELYDALVAKETKSKTAKSVVKSEVKAKIDLEELDHDDAVNLLLKYGGYDDKKDAEKEVKIYELLHSDDINYNTLGESYREGEISKDDVIAARINIAGDTEEEAEQYVSKQDFQSQFGFSYTDMKDKYRAGKITASQAITWRMRCSGVTRESAAEWVQAQDVYLATGYEYVSTGSASYYDSYATKETIGSNTFYERHISEFPNKKAFGAVFNDLDTNSKEKTFPTLTNRYGELGSKQTRVIFTLRDHIAKGNISPALAKEIWEEYYGYSTYNWHFVTD